ncbi:MAG: class I SAM-dependent methyltransferase [Clostridia bacterium]|nr:class I SAM-dependent methyltransferase [Clostridia bacterium]
MDVINHYDLLADENNDPFHDPPFLQEYMNLWDGEVFLESLELNKTKDVLEIGVGTGRLAAKTAPLSKSLTGIDISPKTIERAKENLAEYANVCLICDDFTEHTFSNKFDVIYSSLTMMHFKDKKQVVAKVDSLLNDKGVFCLSIDKNQSRYIDMRNRKLEIYPDTPDEIISFTKFTDMELSNLHETKHAYIIVCKK